MIIVGLGNPGKKYESTRHNIGFLFVDFLASQYGGVWKEEKKFSSLIAEIFMHGEKHILMKPQTYMNLSGQSVQSFLSFFKIPIEDIVIIYDDKDMIFGKLRIRRDGSSGGHNGMKSIINQLGSESFLRLKIGVANDMLHAQDTADFVLSAFSSDEKKQLQDICVQAEELLINARHLQNQK